jgi:hypothetical protein
MSNKMTKQPTAIATRSGIFFPMEIFENRLATFRRLKWPHLKDPRYPSPRKVAFPFSFLTGLLHVLKFAACGFYFVQLKDSIDTVTCFLCHKHLDGWDPCDDPWTAHLQHGKVKTAPKSSSSHPARPASTREEYAPCPLTALHLLQSRSATFVHWPHDKQKEMKATPDSVSHVSATHLHHPL